MYTTHAYCHDQATLAFPKLEHSGILISLGSCWYLSPCSLYNYFLSLGHTWNVISSQKFFSEYHHLKKKKKEKNFMYFMF